MLNVLLTGGTGFLGYRTLEKLVTLDWVNKVIVNGRTLMPERKVYHQKVDYKLGSLENPIFVDELMNGVDLVIHAAALSSPWGKACEFNNANLLTQKNIIKSAKKYGIKRLIYISSPSIYFDGKSRYLVKESDPLPKHFINHYARTKREAEIVLEQSKIPHITLRPRALIGRGDSIIMPRLIRAHNQGKLRLIGDGKNRVDLTSVENVVDAILLSCQAGDEALNQAYNITNGEPVALWEYIEYVLNALNLSFEKKKIPYDLAYAIAFLLEKKSLLTNKKEPALTTYSVGNLGLSFTLDISKAKQLLGYQPNVNTRQAVDEFIKWYKLTI